MATISHAHAQLVQWLNGQEVEHPFDEPEHWEYWQDMVKALNKLALTVEMDLKRMKRSKERE